MSTQVFQSITLKVLGIGFLALLMLIPLAQVQDLISEREGLAVSATQTIASRWGGEQIVGGPVLIVPVRRQVEKDNQWVTKEIYESILPDHLVIRGSLAPELRRYGIYETPVYTAQLQIEGSFSAADLAALKTTDREPLWERAELRIPIADVRGIRRVSTLRFADRELNFGPSSADIGEMPAIAVSVPLPSNGFSKAMPFAFDLSVAGTEKVSFLPLARRTETALTSAWPNPSFDGAFLPAEREITPQGFTANWQVLDLNRQYGQHWKHPSEVKADVLQASAFGVSLLQPSGFYQRNVRAGKYGLLFIGLTFVAFFLFEVLKRLRVHPVQYLLVGISLCTFYIVLLAFSEQMGFDWAYWIAAISVVGMIAGYAAAVLATWRAGLILGVLLSAVYALLYGLVVSEDYSLLMGAVALLATVAALMFLTRRVDWYALNVSNKTT